MFTLMGNCISCIKKKRQPKRTVTLAILGLDSAGKTTTTNAFLGDPLETAPTIGFSKEEFPFLNYNINLYDLGGGHKIRDIWKDYLHEIYGVIFVVDSAAPERFPEVKQSLTALLHNEKVKGKPLLILANKDDLPDHLVEVDIMEQLGVEDLVNVNKCYCHMQMCSAIKGTGRKIDPKIKNGMTWLCGILDKLYDKLKARVDADIEVIEEIRRKEKEARKERVRKQREEREKQKEEERIRLGEDKVEDDDDDDGDFVDGDPFRKLDADEIKRKEAKYKEAKAKEKERQRKLRELDEQSEIRNNNVNDIEVTSSNTNATPGGIDDDDDDGLRAPRSSRSLFGMNWMNGSSNVNSRQLLPPLEGQSEVKSLGISPRSDKKRSKKMKNKVQSYDIDYNNYDGSQYAHGMSSMSRIEVEPINGRDDEDDADSIIQSSSRLPFRKSRGLYIDDSSRSESPDIGRQKNSKKKQQVLSSDGEDGFDTLRLSQYVDEEEINGYSKTSHSKDSKYPVSSQTFTNDHTEDRSGTPVKKTKKKKKHLRKNKLSPSDDEFELSDVQTTPQKKKQWTRSPSPGKMLEDEDRGTNWGLAEDLPSGDEVQQFRRSGPNFDAEDELQL